MFHANREQAGRGVVTHSLALSADAELLESEELLELDVAILDSDDLRHAHDTADTTTQTQLLNDHVDGGTDRLPDGAGRQVLPCLENQRLETDQRFFGVVRMQRRH